MATAYASFGTESDRSSRARTCCAARRPSPASMVAAGLRELGRRRSSRARRPRSSATATDVRLELVGRLDAHGAERVPGRDRAHAPHPGDLGLETVGLKPGRLARGRRHDARGRVRLALRGRRREPPRAAHPPGQVPGPRLRATSSRRGRRAIGWTTRPGAVTSRPPTTPRCRRSRSRTPRSRASDSPRRPPSSAGLDIRVLDYDLSWVAGATIQADGYRGKARMVVDEEPWCDRRRHLRRARMWPSCCTPRPSRSSAEVPIARLWHAVPAYPTVSEVWLRFLETYRG